MALTLVKRASLGWPEHPNVGTAPCKNGMVGHYDGSDQGLARKSHSECIRYWKNTRKFHMGPQRGWSDIGYSFGICPHGIVLEGRGFGYQQAAQPGGNSTYTSVSFMSGEHEDPTDLQLQAWRDLRAYLRSKKGVASRIKGHRDFISTSCPGGKIYKLITNTKSPLYVGGVSRPSPVKPIDPAKLAVPNGTPVLKRGTSAHGRTKMLQECLNAVLKRRLVLDGDFGLATEDAVVDFQAKAGFSKKSQDGVYGEFTEAALRKAVSKL